MRRDIADVRLAEYVFAPHYAEPVEKIVRHDVMMRDGPGRDAGDVIALVPGDRFDLLDLTGGMAWGIACASGLVGYIDGNAIGAGAA